MKVLAARFWNEEAGFLLSAEAVLYATLLVIGLIAGLSSVRESVVTELGDVAQAIGNLNQTFSYGASVGHCGITAGASFTDKSDFCDVADPLAAVQQSKCILICTQFTCTTFAGQDGN